MSNRGARTEQKPADQRVHLKEPEPFPSPEAASEVIGYNRDRFKALMQHHREQDRKAQQKLAERQDLEGRIAQLRAQTQQVENERAQFEVDAATARNAADGPRMVLEMFGAEIPQLPPVEMPAVPQGTPQQVANWNGPETGAFNPPDPSFADNPQVGNCGNCREPVWPSSVAPTGVTHGVGELCDPNDPHSTVAVMGQAVGPS